MRPVRAIAAMTLGLVSVGCSVQFNYGARPLPPPPATREESCYQNGRMDLGVGVAKATWYEPAGQAGNVQYHVAVVQQAEGLTFYERGLRLGVPEAVHRLGDAELEQAYSTRLAELESESRTGRWLLGSGIAGTFVGIGVALGSVPFMLDDSGDGTSISSVGMGMMIAGAAVIVAGSILWMAGGRKLRRALYEEQVYRNLFVDRNLTDRLMLRMREYNQRIAGRCGFTGPVEVRAPGVAPAGGVR